MGKHQMYDILKKLQQPGKDQGLAPAFAFPLTKPKTTQCFMPVFLRPLQSKKTTLLLSSSNAAECSWSINSWNPSPFHSSIIFEQAWKNYKPQPVLKYEMNSGKYGRGSAVCTPRSCLDTSSSEDNFSFACLTLYQRITPAFQTSQLIAQPHCMKQPVLSRKCHCTTCNDLNFCWATSKPEVKPEKDKNHEVTLKPSSPNTWHSALSTTIPLPPKPPYLTRTHIRNHPVFWNLFRSQDLCSGRPSTQSHITAQGPSLAHCFCLRCLGSGCFFWTRSGYALRAGMKLFGSWVIWHCGLPISSCWMWAIPNMLRHSPWESKQVWLEA